MRLYLWSLCIIYPWEGFWPRVLQDVNLIWMTLSCIAATLIATRYYVTCIYFKLKNTGYVFLEDVNHGASYSCGASTMKKLTMSKHPESPSPRGRNAYTSTFHLAMVCILMLFSASMLEQTTFKIIPLACSDQIINHAQTELSCPGKPTDIPYLDTDVYTWVH